jgi:hypothetical protein
VLREPSGVEVRDPLQTIDTDIQRRLVAWNPKDLMPLSFELMVRAARRFGNVCLMPSDQLSLATLTHVEPDGLMLRFATRVTVLVDDLCRSPFAPDPRP